MDVVAPARFHGAHKADGASCWLEPVGLMPDAALHICVIIPAKDEAIGLPDTLQALATQRDAGGLPFPAAAYEVLLLANNCTDDTAAVARACARHHPQLRLHVLEATLPAAQAHVGLARRLLMDEAARRLELASAARGIIASTDADTRVAPDWLAALQAEFAAGADAVGGRILPDAPAASRSPVRRLHLRDAAYRLGLARLEHLLDPCAADPWPRHHQHFGGNLALTVAAYRQVGGLPIVPFLEDEALWQQLRRHDLRLRHSPAVRVGTSHRQVGRVAVGLSWQLRTWADDAAAGRDPLAEHPARLAAEWQARRQLRTLWPLYAVRTAVVSANLSTDRRGADDQSTAGRSGADCFPVAACAERAAADAVTEAALASVAAALATAPDALRALLQVASSFGAAWEAVRPAAVAAWAERWPPLPLKDAVAELRRHLAAAEQLAAGQQIEAVLFHPVAVEVL